MSIRLHEGACRIASWFARPAPFVFFFDQACGSAGLGDCEQFDSGKLARLFRTDRPEFANAEPMSFQFASFGGLRKL